MCTTTGLAGGEFVALIVQARVRGRRAQKHSISNAAAEKQEENRRSDSDEQIGEVFLNECRK